MKSKAKNRHWNNRKSQLISRDFINKFVKIESTEKNPLWLRYRGELCYRGGYINLARRGGNKIVKLSRGSLLIKECINAEILDIEIIGYHKQIKTKYGMVDAYYIPDDLKHFVKFLKKYEMPELQIKLSDIF